MKRALRGSKKSDKWLRDKLAQASGYKDHEDAVKHLKNKLTPNIKEVGK